MSSPPGSSASPPPSSLESKLSFSTVQAANKAFAVGDLLEARQLCTKALVEYTPYHPVIYANRACIYSKLGYHDLAAGDAYRAVMLMEYVRAVLEGLEEDSDEEDTNEETDMANDNEGEVAGTPTVEAGTDAGNEAPSEVEQGDAESDEEGEPASIFTHIAQAAYATVSQFLKLSKGMAVDDKSDVRIAELSAFVQKFDMLASFYLINSLRQTSSILDAYEFCESTLKRYGPDTETAQKTETSSTISSPGDDLKITPETFMSLKTTIMAEMNMKLEKALEAQKATGDISPEKSRTILSSGVARRECYPWNTYEPDRFSKESLEALNVSMRECAERALGPGNVKCEAKVVALPDLNDTTGEVKMSQHLGIFCTQDIYEGEVFFSETTTISGHPYPGRRILCDYCSSKLPTDPSSHHLCPKCPTNPTSTTSSSELPLYPAYCSETCLSLALAAHHPTLCHHEDDLSWIYSDIISSPNPISIYSTLLVKLFATSLSRNIHPLALSETKYLYGVPSPDRGLTMRWDFVSCVVRPIWIMTQCLGVDIYAYPEKFDTWVITTLLAKIMGTCSGRFEPVLGLSAQGNGECDDRPEVVNVHPTWALVNHDCEPNVGWKPEGKGRFWGLQPRGLDEPRKDIVAVKKGEEVKSCYTDRKLGVKIRREWARDMLGGDCLCARCVREDEEAVVEGVEKMKV